MEKTPSPSRPRKTPLPKDTATDMREIEQYRHLIKAIESSGLHEFTEYIRSPWKMLFPNFIAGIARGLGALVGVAVVLGGIGWVFASTISLPLIGKKLEPYVNKAQNEMNRYIEQTNYEDEFRALDSTLKAIEKNTTPKN